MDTKEGPAPTEIDTEGEKEPLSAQSREVLLATATQLQNATLVGEIGPNVFGVLNNLGALSEQEQLDWLIRIYGDKHLPKPETLASESLTLHKSPLFFDIENKIASAFQKKDNETEASYKERLSAYTTECKKPFFSLVATGKLSVKDIEHLLAGGLRFSPLPPENVGFALASVSSPSGKGCLSLYEPFFQNENNDRAHVLKHALGHFVAQRIFAKERGILSEYARIPEAPLEQLPSHFRLIIEMTRQPQKASQLEHRGAESCLARKLEKLAQTQKSSGEQSDKMASQLVHEILADRIAMYLEAGGEKREYGALRFAPVKEEMKGVHFSSEIDLFEAIDNGFREKESWYAPTVENGGVAHATEETYYEWPEPLNTIYLLKELAQKQGGKNLEYFLYSLGSK